MTDAAERRTEPRSLFTVTVKYAFYKSAHLVYQTDLGLTTDMSRTGLGLYTNRAIDVGESLKLYSKRLSDKPVEAQVKWCARVSESLFRVGLSFA
ncbi:MAG: hypothetical protein Kow0025_13550 [Thermodesulfovibrionales bacterium]